MATSARRLPNRRVILIHYTYQKEGEKADETSYEIYSLCGHLVFPDFDDRRLRLRLRCLQAALSGVRERFGGFYRRRDRRLVYREPGWGISNSEKIGKFRGRGDFSRPPWDIGGSDHRHRRRRLRSWIQTWRTLSGLCPNEPAG